MCLGRELACIYAPITPSSVDPYPRIPNILSLLFLYTRHSRTRTYVFILSIQHLYMSWFFFTYVGVMHDFASMLHNRICSCVIVGIGWRTIMHTHLFPLLPSE